ncbi:MAG: phosphoadenosine phosphosulfate reductase family protein [Christensenellales bacterium]
MPIKRATASMDVVEAATRRVRNVFANGVHVYMSFSGGKDSICLANIVYNLIKSGEADASQLTVIYIDEEAVYDCVIEVTKVWRKRFMIEGAEFKWYALPLKQVSCFNQLTNEESWITFEPGKEKEWVRQPPPYAIRQTPRLKKVGSMNYQTLLPLITRDGIMMTGVRAAESVQRLQYMSQLNLGRKGITGANMIYPIYDWKDNDIWKYIRDNQLDIPEAYLWLYQCGVNRHAMRISNFFATDSLAGLKHVAETDPKLWAKIERREPNAYMTMLYWDSEMYKRSTRERKKAEGESTKDYKVLCHRLLFVEPDKHFTNPTTKRVAHQYKRCYTKVDGVARPRDYKQMYEALIAGDPKLRSLRAIYQNVYGAYAESAKQHRTCAEVNA